MYDDLKGLPTTFFSGVGTMGIATLVHIVTLPVEWDASFRRAVPVLQAGKLCGAGR